jgi:hypothetical protein
MTFKLGSSYTRLSVGSAPGSRPIQPVKSMPQVHQTGVLISTAVRTGSVAARVAPRRASFMLAKGVPMMTVATVPGVQPKEQPKPAAFDAAEANNLLMQEMLAGARPPQLQARRARLHAARPGLPLINQIWRALMALRHLTLARHSFGRRERPS